MLFYYVRIKDRHDPGVNIREKASVASINEAGDSRGGGGGMRFQRGERNGISTKLGQALTGI